MFEHIHSKRHNRLSVEKMNDLVFVHYNHRLRMRKNAIVHMSPIILDEVDLEAEWANENQTAPGTPTTVFSDDDIDWIDQVDIEAEAVAMAEEEQRARAETGNTKTQSDTVVPDVGEHDTAVPDVGEHGMVSRGATMGNTKTQSDTVVPDVGEHDTAVPDVGEHGMVSRGATMAAESSRTYFKCLRRGPGREGAVARPSEP
ncbi:uncharacterized protein LOC131052305 [Cryptomeria japonica]|uniref:uncharacterized protein LOC131052305 n=1 Tax=Cryptomeria japonica TaxID=3369 RepID=UPI0025ACA484|nr:uncharacterized protein LOC131052305 [Cryptomeria japonica]